MKTMRGLALVLAATLALAAGPALAKPGQGGGNGNGNGHGPKSERGNDEGRGGPSRGPESNVSVNIHIGDSDRRVIRDYYVEHRYEPERLPPGIVKNLARGKPLPPGIAKRYMPRELVTRLPPRPDCDWLVIGVDAVLVDRHSGFVIDIAANIFP